MRDGRALLIRRGQEPLYGRWSVPGGRVELGESLEQALRREMEEETGLVVAPVEILGVFDRIERDEAGVLYHFVIVDYLCRWLSGEAVAGSDALELAWAPPGDLPAYDLPLKALEVVRAALRRYAQGAPAAASRAGG